jgi:carbon starvation protein
MKIGTIAFLVVGVIWGNPELKMPAFSEYAAGGGPIIPGTLFPFAFITIACGAISGFHSLISSGTTPKMVDKESDIRPIGYGAMLIEGLVGVMAIIKATAMHPGDYYAINVPVAAQPNFDLPAIVNLHELEAQVGETVAGRTGGGVSLAVGMAQIFSALPGMRGLIAYWYHFAIMFEALFILTTIDAGTRVARFLVQEAMSHVYKPFGRTDWVPGSIIATTLVVSARGYLIYTGEINTIWPMFGISNQLLAVVALTVGTTIIINMGKVRYAWVTGAPMVVLAVITLSAGWVMLTGRFIPDAIGPDPAKNVVGWIDTICTIIMMILVVVIVGAAAIKWKATLSSPKTRTFQPSES